MRKRTIKVLLDGAPHREVPLGMTRKEIADFDGVDENRITWDIGDAKAIALETLKVKREKKLDTNIVLQGRQFRADERALSNIMSAITYFMPLANRLPDDYTWGDAYGLQVAMNGAKMKALAEAIFERVDQIHKDFQAAVLAVNQASTMAEIRLAVRNY